MSERLELTIPASPKKIHREGRKKLRCVKLNFEQDDMPNFTNSRLLNATKYFFKLFPPALEKNVSHPY